MVQQTANVASTQDRLPLRKRVGLKRNKASEESQSEARNDYDSHIMMVQPTATVANTQDGLPLKKTVGLVKRDKASEETQLEARNDCGIRKINSPQPASRRTNLSVIMRNKKAGKSVDDARIMAHSNDQSTNLETEPDETNKEQQDHEPQQNVFSKAFLGLGYYVGEGTVAGCKKIAELTK